MELRKIKLEGVDQTLLLSVAGYYQLYKMWQIHSPTDQQLASQKVIFLIKLTSHYLTLFSLPTYVIIITL